MEINDVQVRYLELSEELKRELSKMERSDKVFNIRYAIKELQALCPHNNGNFDFSDTEECPYCHIKFK